MSESRSEIKNVAEIQTEPSRYPAEKEGSTRSTDNRYMSLDVGHSPRSRIDPLSSSTVESLGGHLNVRSEIQTSNPKLHPTYHDRKLETIDIETTHEGKIGGRGVMFDIRTKTDAKVRIRSFTFHSHSIDMCNVNFFTKRGTHRSFEENSIAWTNIVNTTIECKGPQTTSAITSSMFDSSLSDQLIIEADIGRAIYIDSSNILRYSLTNSADEVFTQDSYVQILEGSGLTQEYGDLHSPRMWNGVLKYELVDELVASEIVPQLSDELVASEIIPQLPDCMQLSGYAQLPGCAGTLTTPSNDSSQSYGHIFNIGSNYPGGIIIDGIEFHTHKTTKLNYKIFTIATNYIDNMATSDWTLVTEGSITGGGESAATAIAGSNFAPVSIKEMTTRGFYITLDTRDLRYADSSRKMGEIFVENDHISIEVGVGVADYPMGEKFFLNRQWYGRIFYRTVTNVPYQYLWTTYMMFNARMISTVIFC